MDAVLLRALVALLLVSLGLGLYRLYTGWQLARARRHTRGLEALQAGVPAILYFTTPNCQPCKTIQRPALQQLSGQWGDRLQIIEVDASRQPELADYWGVLSVPTTFIIDSSGDARRVNHGVARAGALLRQLEEAEGGPLLLPGEQASPSPTTSSAVR